MAVAFDSVGPSSAGTSSSTTPLTWTHTPSGTPTAVVIGGTSFSGASNLISAVTYGGASCSLLSFVSAGSNGGMAAYIKSSPAAGAQTVSETFSGAADTIGGSMSFTGSSGNGTAVTATSTGASSLSVSVPSTTTGGMIAAAAAYGGGTGSGTFSGTNSVTVRYALNGGTSSQADNSAGGTVPSTGGGASQSAGFSNTAGVDDWSLVAVELLPPSGSTSGPPLSPEYMQRPPALIITNAGWRGAQHSR